MASRPQLGQQGFAAAVLDYIDSLHALAIAGSAVARTEALTQARVELSELAIRLEERVAQVEDRLAQAERRRR